MGKEAASPWFGTPEPYKQAQTSAKMKRKKLYFPKVRKKGKKDGRKEAHAKDVTLGPVITKEHIPPTHLPSTQHKHK